MHIIAGFISTAATAWIFYKVIFCSGETMKW